MPAKMNSISVDEVIAEFLRAEWYRGHNNEHRVTFDALVRSNEFWNPALNNKRWDLLEEGRKADFTRFNGRHRSWFLAQINQDELGSLLSYRSAEEWGFKGQNLGSLPISFIVENMKKGEARGGIPLDGGTKAIGDLIIGEFPLDRIILIEQGPNLVILEGNHRAAAFQLVGRLPRELIIGFNP